MCTPSPTDVRGAGEGVLAATVVMLRLSPPGPQSRRGLPVEVATEELAQKVTSTRRTPSFT